jgi:hypothetical protein
MVQTVFICFIHGFKGDEETFFQFPEVCLSKLPRELISVSNFHLQNLRDLVAEKASGLNVRTAVYPKYDTRGDLAVCVEAFKEWYAIRS